MGGFLFTNRDGWGKGMGGESERKQPSERGIEMRIRESVAKIGMRGRENCAKRKRKVTGKQ